MRISILDKKSRFILYITYLFDFSSEKTFESKIVYKFGKPTKLVSAGYNYVNFYNKFTMLYTIFGSRMPVRVI